MGLEDNGFGQAMNMAFSGGNVCTQKQHAGMKPRNGNLGVVDVFKSQPDSPATVLLESKRKKGKNNQPWTVRQEK